MPYHQIRATMQNRKKNQTVSATPNMLVNTTHMQERMLFNWFSHMMFLLMLGLISLLVGNIKQLSAVTLSTPTTTPTIDFVIQHDAETLT